jgi:hypothetical protein
MAAKQTGAPGSPRSCGAPPLIPIAHGKSGVEAKFWPLFCQSPCSPLAGAHPRGRHAAVGTGADAISGLGEAFFYAGAKALLVTGWPVETTSAKVLTTTLFQRPKTDHQLNRVQVLQKTMIDLMDGPGRSSYAYAHPIFWAPFIIVGDSAD